jgi:RHS repeat-associated protein
VRSSTGTSPTDKKFTGQRLDNTGLYYYNARYYDPSIGRFISADTIVPNPANPQSLNRYSYCRNNPLKYIDSEGHVAILAALAVGFIIGAVVNTGIYLIASAINNEQITAQGVLGAAVSGGITGAVGVVAGPIAGTICKPASIVITAAINGTAGITAYETQQIIQTGTIDTNPQNILVNGASNAFFGSIPYTPIKTATTLKGAANQLPRSMEKYNPINASKNAVRVEITAGSSTGLSSTASILGSTKPTPFVPFRLKELPKGNLNITLNPSSLTFNISDNGCYYYNPNQTSNNQNEEKPWDDGEW